MSVYTLPVDKTGYSKKLLNAIADHVLTVKDIKTVHAEMRAWKANGLASGKRGRTAATVIPASLQKHLDHANRLSNKWSKIAVTACVLYNVDHPNTPGKEKTEISINVVADAVRAGVVTSRVQPTEILTTAATA